MSVSVLNIVPMFIIIVGNSQMQSKLRERSTDTSSQDKVLKINYGWKVAVNVKRTK